MLSQILGDTGATVQINEACIHPLSSVDVNHRQKMSPETSLIHEKDREDSARDKFEINGILIIFSLEAPNLRSTRIFAT